MAIRVNLGSGEDYQKGWINVDILKKHHPEIMHNLEKVPYPFKKNSVDEINCFYVLEHIRNRFDFLNEILRICKNGAMINIRVPHWSHFLTWSDLQHVGGFSIESFDIYKRRYANDGEPFFIVKEKVYEAYISSSKILTELNNKIVNLSPKLTEILLCKIFPVQVIRFKLQVVKPNASLNHNKL